MNDALGELGLVPNGLVRMFLFGNQVHDQTNKCSEKRNIKQEKMCGLLTLKPIKSCCVHQIDNGEWEKTTPNVATTRKFQGL